MKYKRTHRIKDVVWRKCIAEMKSNNFELYNIFPIACDRNNEKIHVPFNKIIIQSII